MTSKQEKMRSKNKAMNDFIEKLVNIRSGIGDGAKILGKGIANTMHEMSPKAVKGRQKNMADYRQARDQDMMNRGFGGEEAYLNTFGAPGTQERQDNLDLTMPLYEKLLRKLLGGN